LDELGSKTLKGFGEVEFEQDFTIAHRGIYKYDMRATEILNEVTRPDDRWIASEILSRSGWHVLGAGSFGSVYDKEGVSYVLKLFDADDTAYRAFLGLIQQHPNPHFPKIIGKPMAVSKTVYAVRMEKLSRFRGMADLYAHYVRFRDDTNMDPHGWAASRMSDAEELFYDQPDLKVALDLIHDLVKRFQPDISPDNIMTRGSTVVFIDPVCNPRDGTERPIMSVPWREPPPPPPKPMSKRMQDILDDDELMRELTGE
jgi:hypothetical protein